MSGRPVAMLMIGFGLGGIGGTYLHTTTAVWGGLTLVVLGIGVAIAGRRGAADPADPVDPVAGADPVSPEVRPKPAREGLAGLGTRVEQIMRLAEEQTRIMRADAEREADRIVADARAEAQAIIENAREQAP